MQSCPERTERYGSFDPVPNGSKGVLQACAATGGIELLQMCLGQNLVILRWFERVWKSKVLGKLNEACFLKVMSTWNTILSDITSRSVYYIFFSDSYSIWHSFWHSIWQLFRHTFWHIFGYSFWRSISYIFRGFLWGPAVNRTSDPELKKGRREWLHYSAFRRRQHGDGWCTKK